MEVLQQSMDVYRYSPAYPELAAPVIAALNKIAKETKIAR